MASQAQASAAVAPVNERDENGQTPLIRAVINDDPGLVQVLLEQGADLFIKDRLAMSALDYAQDNPEILSHIGKYLESNILARAN